MIYRIQTLYLLFSLVISCFTAIYDFLQPVYLEVFQIFWAQDYFLGYFFTISGSFSFLSIVFFKKRIIQLKINLFNILLNIIFILVVFYSIFQKSLSNLDYRYFLNILTSTVLTTFFFLSNRFIQKDEFLIKSINQIR